MTNRPAFLTLLLALSLALTPPAAAEYYGSRKIDDTLTFTAQTSSSTGAAIDADSLPTYRVYEDETGTAILTGTMALLDDANTVGWYSEQITLSAANGFEKGKSYNIRVSGTVAGVAGAEKHSFQIEAEVDANVVSDKTGYTANPASGGIAAASFAAGAIDNAAFAVTETLNCDVLSLSGDATAADNAELFFDGAGYAGGTTKLGVNLVSVTDGSLVDADFGSDVRLGIDWSQVASPTSTVGLSNTTVGTATTVTGASVSAANVDDDHTWRFDDPSQMTAPNDVTEVLGSASVLAAMDFDEPLPANSSIQSITSVTVADVAGETEPTVTGSSIHTAKRKVVIDLNTSAATDGTYTVSVKILTTDSQTLTRKGRLVLQ